MIIVLLSQSKGIVEGRMVSKTKIDLITNVAAIDQVHHWLMAQVMSEK